MTTRPAEARVARRPVGGSDVRRASGGVHHREHVMDDPAVAGHRLREGEVAIVGERRGDAEAAVDVAAARGNREGLRAQHEVGCPPAGGGLERRRGRQIARVALGGAGLDPASDRGDLFLREPADTDEISVVGHRLPRRHRACPRRLENLRPAPVDLVVRDQMERSAAAGAMTLLAVLLQDRRDVAGERWIGRRGADAERSGDDGDEHRQQQPRQRYPHSMILNSTRRSSASRASSVPVPTRFSRKPFPAAFVREASSGASVSRRFLM
jgi:hypothetical protein